MNRPFKFVDRVSRGQVLPQYGDGSSSRDYTYIDDIVDGVVRAVDRPYPYQVFNLGKGSGTKLSDFIELVEKYTGLKANIKQMDDQPGDVPYTCADVRKAEYLLGYKASVPFEEGIKRTVAWYKEAYPQHVNMTKMNTTEPHDKAKIKLPSPGVNEAQESPLFEKDKYTDAISGSTSDAPNVPTKEKGEKQEEVVCNMGSYLHFNVTYSVYSPAT